MSDMVAVNPFEEWERDANNSHVGLTCCGVYCHRCRVCVGALELSGADRKPCPCGQSLPLARNRPEQADA